MTFSKESENSPLYTHTISLRGSTMKHQRDLRCVLGTSLIAHLSSSREHSTEKVSDITKPFLVESTGGLYFTLLYLGH